MHETSSRTSQTPEPWQLAVALSADGRRVLRIAAGVAELDGRALTSHAVAGAVLDGAAWVVTREDGAFLVRRFDERGAETGAPTSIAGLGDALRFTASRRGPRTALLEGAIAVELRERDGALIVTELGPREREPRVLLPGRGVFERRGNTLAPCTGSSRGFVLAPDLANATLVSATLVFGGAATAIELSAPGGSSLLVVDTRSGELRTRIRLGDATVAAVAEQAGTVVLARERHIAVLDLRTGRCSHERIIPAELQCVAVSAAGDRLVVVDKHGGEAHLRAGLADEEAAAPVHESYTAPANEPPAADLAAPATDDAAPAADDADAEPVSIPPEPALAAVPDEPPPAPDALPDAPLLGLCPLRVRSSLTEAARREFLEDTYELVAAWCRTAVARATNEGLEAARADERTAAERRARWERVATPFSELAAELDLSPLARTILLVAAAPQLWGELAGAYAAVAANPARAVVDELLVCELLEIHRADRVYVARELDDGAPLIQHGLIALAAGTRPFAALEVPHVVIRRLLGDRFDEAADKAAGLHCADRVLDDLHGPRERIAELVAELAREPLHGPARVVLRGRAGAGRRTLAAALALRAGRDLGVVELAAGTDLIARLRRSLRDAHLRGWIACVSGIERLAGGDAALRDGVREVLDAHPGPLFVRCDHDAAVPLSPGYASLELPPLALAERRAAWRDALEQHDLPVAAGDALAERYAVGVGTVHRITAQIADADPGGPDAIAARLERAICHRRGERLGRLANRVDRLATWDELVLPDDTLDSVRELVARARLRSTVLDAWGMARVATTGGALVALFQGGPGTGKTLVAGAVARALGYELYRVDLSRVVSKWLGETERNLAELFDAAEDGRCILLFDEADSLFGKRTDVKSSNDRHANLEVNYLLQRLDSFAGMAILTTNFGSAIDPAFKRRLALHLQFPFPDEAERERLWRAHVPASVPTAGDLELAELARKFPLSGGYIRNAALRAAYLAASERVSVTAELLRRAVLAEYRDKAKLSMAGTLE